MRDILGVVSRGNSEETARLRGGRSTCIVGSSEESQNKWENGVWELI
jgi:hypothetical protein